MTLSYATSMVRNLFALGLLAFAGCGGRGLTPVSGVVTVKGSPVSFGTITFVPVGSGERASAQIGPAGRFDLGTYAPGDGAMPGEYSVMIAAFRSPPAMGHPDSGKPAIAIKYFDAATSGLTATVHSGRALSLDFDLDE